MDMHTLEAYYCHHTPTLQDASSEYAVLIPLLQKADGLHLLYEVRASSLHHHRNEVCFPGGRMEPGAPADLVIFDADRQWKVDGFESKSSNSPFLGETLTGKVVYTICGGKVVYGDGD